MPRKQRFKPSRKPKQPTDEVGGVTVEQQTRTPNGGDRAPDRERHELRPDEVEVSVLDLVNGAESGRQE